MNTNEANSPPISESGDIPDFGDIPENEWSPEIIAQMMIKPMCRPIYESARAMLHPYDYLTCPEEGMHYKSRLNSFVAEDLFETKAEPIFDGIAFNQVQIKYTPRIPSRVSSAASIDVMMDQVKVKNVRHGLIESLLTTIPETSIKDRMWKLTDIGDIEGSTLTPDIIVEDNNLVYYVVEIATCQCWEESDMAQVFMRKKMKYQGILSEIANKWKVRIVYNVLVVSSTHIYTDIEDIPLDDIDIMCLRCLIGLDIEFKLAGLIDFKSPDDPYEAFIYQGILHSLSSIEPKYNHVRFDTGTTPETILDEKYVKRLRTEEPDKAYVSSLFAECMKRGMRELNQDKMKNSASDNMDIFDNYLTNLKGERVTDKAVTLLPLIVSMYNAEAKFKVNYFTVTYEGNDMNLKATADLWSEAIRLNSIATGHMNDHILAEEQIRDCVEKENEPFEEERKSTYKRSEQFRVDVYNILTEAEKKQLAMLGINGKRYRNDNEVKTHKEITQKCFSIEAPIDDISEFIEDYSIYSESMSNPHFPEKELLQKAEMIAQNEGTNYLPRLEADINTNFYQALDLGSQIIHEVVISERQHCDTSTFLIKKLGHYEVYLLIKPTSQDNHIFFSVLYKDHILTIPGPFRKTYATKEGWLFTEFVSVKSHKARNTFIAPFRFLMLCSTFRDVEVIREDQGESLLKNDAYKMINFLMLVTLENKAMTEEVITLLRYVMMELAKTGEALNKPAPGKIVSKYPDAIRSRLQLWVILNSINNIKTMLVKPPHPNYKRINKVDPTSDDEVMLDDWECLIDPILGTPRRSFGSILTTIYAGYAKDKDEKPESHMDIRVALKALKTQMIMTKILESEEETKKVRGDYQFKPGEYPSQLQFSTEVTIVMTQLQRMKLEHNYGDKYDEVITRKIVNRLRTQLPHVLATLKASEMIDRERILAEPRKPSDNEPLVTRFKMMETVILKFQFLNPNPFMKLEKILKEVEEVGGIATRTFQKNQHGGLREIFILDVYARILALFVETISRVFCAENPSETMMNPDSKTKIPNAHNDFIYKHHIEGNKSVTLNSSLDKTNWNQNFVMRGLAAPLLIMVPDSFVNPLVRIFNLFATKMMEVTKAVENLFTHQIILNDPNYMQLMEDYCNDVESKYFINPSKKFIAIEVGFMQGIMHYTSSFLHLALCELTVEMLVTLLKLLFPEDEHRIDTLVSSDDSAYIMTAIMKSEMKYDQNYVQSVSNVMEALALGSEYFSTYAGMVPSIKSTRASRTVLEFNSNFKAVNCVYVPFIKNVFAATNVSETGDLIKRAQQFDNLKTDCLKGGLCLMTVHEIELAQAMLHYRMLGSATSRVFNTYSRLLQEYPHPAYGFFLTSPDKLAGVMGWSYNKWLLGEHCDILSIPQSYYARCGVDANAFETQIDQLGFTETLNMKVGDHARYKRLVNVVTGGRDREFILDAISQDPAALFRKCANENDSLLRIYAKALSPGVADALSGGCEFTKVLKSTTYALHARVFTKTKHKLENGKKMKTIAKVSILGELLNRKEDLSSMRACFKALPNKVRLELNARIFPNQAKYMRINEMLKTISSLMYEPLEHPLRMCHNVITIPCPLGISSIPLKTVLSYHWANQSSVYTAAAINRAYHDYKQVLPWLDFSLKKTLEQSPFTDAIQLAGFIQSDVGSHRSLLLVCPHIRPNGFVPKIYNLIAKHSKPGSILVQTKQARGYMIDSTLVSSRTKVGLSLLLPYFDGWNKYIRNVISNEKPYHDPRTILDMDRRESLYATIIAVANAEEELTPEVVAKVTTKRDELFLLNWVQAQKLNDAGIWGGYGVALLKSEFMTIRLEVYDQVVTLIQVSNLSHFSSILGNFKTKLQEMRFQTSRKERQATVRKYVLNQHRICVVKAGEYHTGTVLEEDQSLLKAVWKDPNFSAQFVHGQMLLMQEFKSKKTKRPIQYKVYGYKIKDHDLNISMVRDNDKSDNVFDAWVDCRTCSKECLSGFITGQFALYETGNKFIKKRAEEWIKWLTKALTQRLMSRGLLPYQKLTDYLKSCASKAAVSKPKLEDFDFLSELDNLKTLGKELKLDYKVESFFDEQIELESDTFANLMGLKDLEDTAAKIADFGVHGESYFNQHPLFDESITYLVNRKGRRGVIEISNGDFNPEDPLERNFAKLLGVTQRIIPPVLVERSQPVSDRMKTSPTKEPRIGRGLVEIPEVVSTWGEQMDSGDEEDECQDEDQPSTSYKPVTTDELDKASMVGVAGSSKLFRAASPKKINRGYFDPEDMSSDEDD